VAELLGFKGCFGLLMLYLSDSAAFGSPLIDFMGRRTGRSGFGKVRCGGGGLLPLGIQPFDQVIDFSWFTVLTVEPI
jgi:hypothetical protein